ncbi:MAG: hypothetical protein NTX25_09025 [Proteobacteria bacterium]|nr:hypothetical protein [Pseudomonadota bacterium]
MMLLLKINRSALVFILMTMLAVSAACKKIKNSTPASPQNAAINPEAPPEAKDFAASLGQVDSLPEQYKSQEALSSGKTWQYIYERRESALKTYIEANQAGFDAFTKTSIALNGTPALIFRLLPVVMPEVFSDSKFEMATGYYKLNTKDLLPYGLAFTKAPAASPGQPSPLLVNLTCAACHTGRILLDDQTMKPIIGAPSTVADVNGFRSILSQAVANPNYTLEKFTAALLAKADGELYGPDQLAEERIDKAIFLGTAQSPALGAAMLKQFKDGLLQRGEYAGKILGTYVYHGDLRLLAHSPGHIDFPVAVSLALAPPAEVLADLAAGLKKYFPTAPGIGDIMSVWRQEDRRLAQWDGNLKGKLTRNLGAELGVAGEPQAVNFSNALITTNFVEKLPAPAYPFAVDLLKAAEGEKIYQSACASCHESELFMPVAAVGTEPGRAVGLSPDTARLLVAALRLSCTDKTVAACTAPDDEIFVPRQQNPGYLALPLTGIWARAPYLHNGSVPTLYHLLVPQARPIVFQLNNFAYDKINLGFQWNIEIPIAGSGKGSPNQSKDQAAQNGSAKTADSAFIVTYDTKIPGYGNAGHSDLKIFNGNIDFSKNPEKLQALLEYLKTR